MKGVRTEAVGKRIEAVETYRMPSSLAAGNDS